MTGKYLAAVLFFIVSVLGSLYLLVETGMKLAGTSICATEGCKVIDQYARFGDVSIVLLGLASIASLAVLSGLNLRTPSAFRDALLNGILILSLASEGFFTGTQMFRLNTMCVFCLSMLGIVMLLGTLRLFAGWREMFTGFAAFAAIVSLFYLILPAGGAALPREARPVLFYSADCKHCTEIREELDRAKVVYVHIPVKEHAATLRTLGIEHVPTLFVSGPYEKIFLTGTDAIRRYISSCRPGPAVRQKSRAPGGLRLSSTPAATTISPSLIFPQDPMQQVLNPAPDEGLCKEEQKCD